LHEIHDLVEMRTMVASLSDEWKAEARRVGLQEGREEGHAQGRAAGHAQGHAEGRQRGLQEGELTLLLRLLRKRFGELPESAHARLEQASMEQLEHWAEQLLQADSLEALFDGQGPSR
jgi:flagellar biosynthesis/type III secretory pathway protein FliH